ncbi:hypothetical protein AB0M28_03220 [Streptomyces sp. NPDC051940]|uniref:tetratricopeptide repeat protein n=1 Tax=Streptomyces sp. NPDC051940 TaxID=3155675 RepID=UPI0034337FFE
MPVSHLNEAGATTRAHVPTDRITTTAVELARAARWQSAAALLDSAEPADAADEARIAIAAAEVALESDWFAGTSLAHGRIEAARARCAEAAELGETERWDLAFLGLRYAYGRLVLADGAFHPGPEGKDPAALTAVRTQGLELRASAPDGVRRGWAEFYLGVTADNLFGERDSAPAHYEAALHAGDGHDDRLAREALRHLGDHALDAGDRPLARAHWERATALGARAGLVSGMLTQQFLLAVLARDEGDEAGAVALAGEIERWAHEVGAARVEAQAAAFRAGA